MLPTFSPTSWRILRQLAPRPKEGRHLRALTGITEKSLGAVQSALKELMASGLLHQETGPYREPYRINVHHPLYPGIRRIIADSLKLPQRERAMVKEFINRLKVLLGPRLKGVILYGSRARGNWQPESDIDLAIIMDTVDPKVQDHISDLISDVAFDHEYPAMIQTVEFGQKEFDQELDRPLIFNIHTDGRSII